MGTPGLIDEYGNGAQERTRTSTPLRAPAPEAGASTNSATWARNVSLLVGRRRLGAPARLVNAGTAGLSRHGHDRAHRKSLSRSSAAAASSAATSANILFKSGRPGPRRQPRSAQRLLPPAARPGRPVRLRAGRHHRTPTASATRSRARPRSINLVRRVRPRRCTAVHVDGARNVAEAAREAGAAALVHISAIGAEPESPVRTTAAPRAKARRRSARLSPRRRSSARRWCSGRRTSSPTASRRWRGCRSCR